MLGTNEHTNDDDWEYGVFGECALENIELPSTLKKIECRAFQGCEGLKSIELPDGLETVGRYCFYESGLEEIILPASVKEIGAFAFFRCRQLRSAQLNEGLKKLGKKEIINGSEYEGSVFACSGI